MSLKNFQKSPDKTLIKLAVPVLFSLIAEPLTGLVDTGFVARIGSEALTSLGIGTMTMSSMFWIFSFLGVGSQTETAQALGRKDTAKAARVSGLAICLGFGFGLLLLVFGLPLSGQVANLLGADGPVQLMAAEYMNYRFAGAPAVLVTVAALGILRGMQAMRTAMVIALGVNALNIGLDWLLIFGHGPFPAMGVGGAGLASALSQWFGAIAAVVIVFQRVGRPRTIKGSDVSGLMRIGWDMFIRTGAVTIFLMLGTRAATVMGPEQGAANQAIRQSFIFTALFLDCFAVSGQSLVGAMVGAGKMAQARAAAFLVCKWSFFTGLVLGAAMLIGKGVVSELLVPASAHAIFMPAWIITAYGMPVFGLAFAADGINWGTGDFRYLRNAMIPVAGLASLAVVLLEVFMPPMPLVWLWGITIAWTTGRAVTGLIRVWPGVGKSPFRETG